MNKTILITGASGRVAKAIGKQLVDKHRVIGVSRSVEDDESYTEWDQLDLLKEKDVDRLESLMENVDAVMHLAWNLKVENFDTGEKWPKNIRMFENVLKAAKTAEVPIFINGSSIHAGTGELSAYTEEASLEDTSQPYRDSINPETDFQLRRQDPEKLVSALVEKPDSPYGESKVETENILRDAVSNGDFELGVSIRIGGVNSADKQEIENEPFYPSIYWSHRDMGRTVENILTADLNQKNGYHQFYGISDNKNRVLSIDNSFTTPKTS